MAYEVERLIIMIQERPSLWDSRTDQYQDRALKDRCWEEIGSELMSAAWESANIAKRDKILKDLKKRWNSCRDQYRCEQNLKARSGDGSLKKKPYLYTGQLEFLKPVMELRRTVDNLSTDSTQNPEESGNISQEASQAPREETREEHSEIPSEPIITSSPEIEATVDTAPVQEPPVRPSSSRPRRRHAAHSDLEVRNLIDSRVLQFLNQNRSASIEEQTIRSLASSLSRVPEERQTLCLSSLCLLIDLYRHSEPFEIVHRMELLRDQQLNVETPVYRLNRPQTSSNTHPGPLYQGIV